MNKFLKQALLASCMISITPVVAAAEKAMIVFDASGSMWAQLDGEAKISIARDALTKVLGNVPQDLELGLIAYGHREKGQCTDIEQVMEPAAGQGSAIADFVNNLQPKGKTPLTDAVEMAADTLKYTEQKATVILITDGIETCNADPCAVADALESKGVDFTTHVIGFGLNAEQRQKVACISDNTGGQYLDANNADSLSNALTKTVVAAPVEQPKPVKAPEPVVTESKVTLLAYLDEEGTIAKDLRLTWTLTPIDGGEPIEMVSYADGRLVRTMRSGKYRVSVKAGYYTYKDLGVKVPEFEVEISGEEAKIEAVLNAAVVEYSIAPTNEAQPDRDGRIDLAFGDTKLNAYGSLNIILPAGQLAVNAKIGDATISKTVEIEAGQIIKERLVPLSGVVKMSGVYSESGPDVEVPMFIQVFHAKKDINGKHLTAATERDITKNIVLKPGKYILSASLGQTPIKSEFSVKAGDVQDMVINFNAGVLYVEMPAAKVIDVLGQKKNINGEVQRFHVFYGGKSNMTLPAGTYDLVMEMKDGTKKTQQVTVKAGEREEYIVK